MSEPPLHICRSSFYTYHALIGILLDASNNWSTYDCDTGLSSGYSLHSAGRTLFSSLHHPAYPRISQFALCWIKIVPGSGSMTFQCCFHQRTLSASSSRTAQLTCFAAAFLIAILGTPPALVGAVAASTDWNLTVWLSSSLNPKGARFHPAPHSAVSHSILHINH
ncbi:hypothetical protein CHARACLAT_019126 [Characodon lateralis]|uniref:Uncharacterized protein n=1 Tax=Characodon lateralis TaxID=208331 RepID=A0ABU7CZI9_9TELE|nr:hypothetical protein [Characodon lateralis]